MNDKYVEKPIEYFSNVRHELISLLPNDPSLKVLEIGAGGGDTLLKIKTSGKAKEVVGIELMKLENSNQNHQLIDSFYFGNLETDHFDLAKNYFDVIICGDVLEHLLDPWSVVKRLSELLAPNGQLIISCPNIRHYTAFIEIFVRGNFPNAEHGLFDKTHLRFFCKKNLKSLAESGGLISQKLTPNFKLLKPNKTYYLNLISFGIFEELLSPQYTIVAKRI